MTSKEMTRFKLKLVERDSKTFDIFLVEEQSAVASQIVAQTSLTARAPALGNLQASTADYDVVMDGCETAGQRVFDLDDAIDDTGIATFAAFRDQDCRGSIADGAYSFLLTKVVPTYDQGSIDVVDDTFVIHGAGLAVNPDADRAGANGDGKAAKPRPKSNRKLKHSWF